MSLLSTDESQNSRYKWKRKKLTKKPPLHTKKKKHPPKNPKLTKLKKKKKKNPSKIHCYSFPPEGEKNYIFQFYLCLVYILLQLTSTINSNLEAPFVTLSPCYRNIQISPKPHF